MSGPGPGGPDPSGPPDATDPPGGSLRPTPVLLLVRCAVVGLVLGSLVRPVAGLLEARPPTVTWGQPVALAVVAAVLGLTAWHTHRVVHVHRLRLAPHQAVNRLAMARACALVGALVGGVYTGYALGQLGQAAELADERMVRSALGALACLGVCVAALLLERACRVRSDADAA